ncbi:MAG: hypothetical protein QOE41_3338 [Mycobacterium sp.]|nr:hypothetical protein [Mycobacterium sp.]
MQPSRDPALKREDKSGSSAAISMGRVARTWMRRSRSDGRLRRDGQARVGHSLRLTTSRCSSWQGGVYVDVPLPLTQRLVDDLFGNSKASRSSSIPASTMARCWYGAVDAIPFFAGSTAGSAVKARAGASRLRFF